jgi:hypothetical protein
VKGPRYKLTERQADALVRLRANEDFRAFLNLVAAENERKLKALVLAADIHETQRGQVQALTELLDTVIDAPNQLDMLQKKG